jgi:hypothetical protein
MPVLDPKDIGLVRFYKRTTIFICVMVFLMALSIVYEVWVR